MYRRRVGPPNQPNHRAARRAFAALPLDACSAGTTILAQGTRTQDVFVLRDGLVKLVHQLPDGRCTVVGLRGRGTILGAESALARRPHPVAVTAVTACRCHRIAAREFTKMLQSGGSTAAWVLTAHFEEFERQVLQGVGLARLSARERLEAYFEFLGAEGVVPAADGVELPLRDWELAQLLAITPSYLSRLMRELEREGRLIRNGRRARIVVRRDAERRAA